MHVPDVRIQRLRQVLSRRRHFVKVCTSQVNAAKYLLRSVELSKETTSLCSGVAWQRLISRPAARPLSRYLAMHRDLWKLAQEKVIALEKELDKTLEPFREMAGLLQSVPGIGPITLASYIAVVGKPDRFPDSSHLVSYIGLAV